MSVVEVFVDVHAAVATQIAIAMAAVVMTHARRIDAPRRRLHAACRDVLLTQSECGFIRADDHAAERIEGESDQIRSGKHEFRRAARW
jgi:hypothetical protein